jgi:hypothetical protein
LNPNYVQDVYREDCETSHPLFGLPSKSFTQLYDWVFLLV